jgi:hypothetical protein
MSEHPNAGKIPPEVEAEMLRESEPAAAIIKGAVKAGVLSPEEAKAMTANEHYELVNGLWPAGPLPKMSRPEAIAAASKLWRKVAGEDWPGTWAAGRGNHRTYPRGRRFLVNPGQGWKLMVHDLSHAAHRRLNPGKTPHAGGHARIESEMIRHVVAMGWLDGRLKPQPKVTVKKPKPTKSELAAARLVRVRQLRKAWETKAKRAATALKKLAREEARLVKKTAVP